ncbi:MAG: RNA polymerase sigma-70 factor [Gemmatimonadota bacterium]
MNAEVPIEDTLAALVRRGDERAFEQLFHREYASLCAFAEQIVGSPQVAEDIVQSVFLKLWSGRQQLPVVASLRAYLFASTRNAALDHLKRVAVEKKWAARPEWLDSRIDNSTPDADAELEAAERASTLADAVRRLPERAKLVVTLRWGHGLSHREIAAALGISPKGVEIQITRALRALRKFMVGERH